MADGSGPKFLIQYLRALTLATPDECSPAAKMGATSALLCTIVAIADIVDAVQKLTGVKLLDTDKLRSSVASMYSDKGVTEQKLKPSSLSDRHSATLSAWRSLPATALPASASLPRE